jgi:prevent-host-death family protein
MRTANVSELKSRLSSYLAYVQQGEEIIVRDRNRPIARIVPLTTEGGEESEETALVAAGVLKLPVTLPASFWSWKGGKITEKRAIKAVRDERDED